jgi:hypothetical protein
MIIISKNISIIVLAIAHAGISIAQQVISCPNGVRARAEWQDLSAGMKKRYFDATIKLHSDGKYDNFSHLHSERYFDWHENSQFLPAHRQYLLEYEKALRAIDPGLTLPYFDCKIVHISL